MSSRMPDNWRNWWSPKVKNIKFSFSRLFAPDTVTLVENIQSVISYPSSWLVGSRVRYSSGLRPFIRMRMDFHDPIFQNKNYRFFSYCKNSDGMGQFWFCRMDADRFLTLVGSTPSKREKDRKGGSSRKINAKETSPNPREYANELLDHVAQCYPSTFEV